MTWTPRPGLEAEILEQLDRCASTFEFPVFDHTAVPVALSRLIAFRSDRDWLITFQTVAWEGPNGLVIAMLDAFGSLVARPGMLDSMNPLTPVGRSSFNGPDGRPTLDQYSFEVEIRSAKRTFSLAPDDYSRAGIDPGERPVPLIVLRYLAATEPDLLLWTDDEILAKVSSGGALERFCRLDRWDHPDIVGGEMPSSSACFAGLAAALAGGDPSRDPCHG